jgi:hypothetical protein
MIEAHKNIKSTTEIIVCTEGTFERLKQHLMLVNQRSVVHGVGFCLSCLSTIEREKKRKLWSSTKIAFAPKVYAHNNKK